MKNLPRAREEQTGQYKFQNSWEEYREEQVVMGGVQFVVLINICIIVAMLDWLFGRKKEEEPKKKQQSAADQQAQNKWKYDFMVQFLSGPLWKTSILDFVDYHCVVFDNEEENKFEYTTIHNKFKEMVASLFDGMMQEVGLDDQQLVELLERGFSSKNKKIFNQLLLADDFLKFKHLMVNRNKALEAEALKAMQGEAPSHSEPRREEDIIKQSILSEKERQRKIQMEQEEQLRKVLEMSKLDAQENQMIKKLEEKVAEKEPVQPEPQKQPQQPQYFQKPAQEPKFQAPALVQAPPQPVPPVQSAPVVIPQESAPAARRRRNLPNLEPLPPVKQSIKVEEEEPKKESPREEPKMEKPKLEEKAEDKQAVESQEDRKKRLMEQRERIRRKKEEERKKQMAEDEAKPAPVQTIVLQEDGIHETQVGQGEEKKVSTTEIERRRELMKKIKNRIIDDF